MSEYTPGPWTDDDMACYVFAGNMMVCQIRGWGHLTGTGALNLPEDKAVEIQKANARLIAAAPEMLEALKSMIARGGESRGEWVPMEVLKQAQAAIAKAEGQR